MIYYKLYYYVPKPHLEQTKNAIFKAGAGKIGNYTCCSWETKGKGQFRPETGSKPYLGKHKQIEKVEEYKVETICPKINISEIIKALKSSHPYEQPAYGIIKIENI